MKIENNKVVTFDYTLKNDAGEVIDTSEGAEPMLYLHGADNIVEGLEDAMVGAKVGDNLQVRVEPGKGYGIYDEGLVQTVPREMFEGVEQIEVGMTFQAETDTGIQVVSVSAIDDAHITVNGNHPLANETLHFDVTITDIRDATDDEKEHGHVHTEGYCH